MSWISHFAFNKLCICRMNEEEDGSIESIMKTTLSVVSVVPQAELCEVASICFVLDHGRVAFTDKN